MQEIIQAIHEEIEKAKKIAAGKGYTFPEFGVRFDLKGSCAGRACYKNGEHYVRFNLEIAKDNLNTFVKRTVNHELAHVLQHRFSLGSKPHGKEWKHFCKVLTGSEMPRCHSYEVSHLTRRRRTYLYTCGCRDHEITSIKHRRIISGMYSYWCKSCGNKLKRI